MNTSVSALHGAMGPLIWKLKVLLLEASDWDPKRWPRLPMGVKDGIDLLKEELEEISASLEDLSELEDPPLTAKCWMKEVRELSYDIEDYIDNFARPSCRTRTKVKTRSVYKVSHVQLNRFPKRKALIWHKEVRIKISEFRIRVQEANERHKRYELDCLDNFRRRYASSGPMLPWIYDEAADLVIDGQMSEFIDILACNIDHQLRVIPIIGPGGLGKTTIARVVYNNIRGQFDCRAFVSMTRKPNIRNILHDILAQVQRHQKRDDCEDLDIMGRIRKHLHGKRYLIVIDYLWDASTWNIISCAFPESSQRSRIIITTQVEDVALTCCRYQPEFVFEMKPLDVYHTRKLFFNIIFGSKSICPVIFKEVLYKILGMCGGSPLATANMASLLARCPLTLMEQLTYIRDSLGITLQRNSTTEGIRQVLNLCYNNLNPCLKSCLLYLHICPEGSIIYSDDLVKQWVAEGFIDAVEGRDIESVARSYFFELIGRRFIQPIYIKYNDDIVSCTVHDTVYDLIAYNSREENFVTVVDADRKNVELSDKVRRLSLNFSDAMYAKLPKYIQPSYIRSLAFFGFFAYLPSMTEFKLLRVLHLQLSCHCGDDILNLNWISELYQLRYLKVISDVFIKLPKNMRGLHHLVTLNIDAKVTTFPCDIIHLPNLLHLRLPFDANMMDWINSMGSDVVRRLDKLTNLRDLHLTSSTVPPNNLEKNMEGLASLIGGLGNLEILVLVPGTSHINTMVHNPPEAVVSWDGFALPLHLKRFEWSQCKYIFSRVPKWIVKSSNLCVLKIMVKELLRADVDILKGLPVLTTLSLYVHSAPLERIVFDKMGFSSLKFFKFRCSVPPWLKFEADAMQNLMKLKLGFNANREDLHHSIQHVVIGHLPCLKQIYVKIGGAGVDAKSALTASVFNHPSNPNINTELVDWVFFGYQGRDRAPEDKDRQDNLVVKKMREEVSWEDTKKQVDLRISTSTESPSRLPISDIQQILKEAQHRWLRPAEICEILKNYRSFHISPEPPNRPPSGSIFLFDRKVLRYFRKDGHNWRKKNDQKTVKEAHERLKSGSIDVLHCYYAHGEDNINFQRRTYWMLEEDFMHIVLVHYLETKGGKSSRARGNSTVIQEAAVDSPLSQLPSHTIEGESSVSGQASEYEEAESADTYSGGTGYDSFTWMQQHENGTGPVIDSSVFSSYTPASSTGSYQGLHSIVHNTSIYSGNQDNSPIVLHGSSPLFTMNGLGVQTDLQPWNEVTKLDGGPVPMPPSQFPVVSEKDTSAEGLGVDYLTFDQVYSDGLTLNDIGASGADGESFWQLSDATGNMPAMENNFPQNDGSLEAAIGYPVLKTQSSSLSDILKDSFKKSDSFTRWMSKELPEVEDSQIQSTSGVFWSTEESLDQFALPPMVSQDQLFSIVDFAPTWTYGGSKTKILISGRILNNTQVMERCKWSCMFGEVEVPAQMLADGTLLCYSPPHKPGRVPFYITCSNRLACSEVREFEFRPNDPQYMDAPSPHGATNKVYFQIRLDKLVSLGPDEYQATISNPGVDMIDLSKKISSLMMNNDEWSMLLKLADDNELSTDDQKDQFAENLIKEKLHVWLLYKVGVGGKGPSVLDDEGQGVLHLAAALGYDWAIRPTVSAGVNINFRDVHGWTALHWAAFCGRERTVVALIALGAAPGALTDPTPDFPSGSTPADLASANGHKGISGFLAESSLTSHLQALNLKEANMGEISGLPGIGDVTERTSVQPATADSLAPVRNAAQAAARIYQVFRVQSFQRKQAAQYEDEKGGISDERALSLLSVKPSKPGQDPLHAAATRIQNKFRGWKGRKEFLLIRQRIVKIQAHVRGHQVRKHYRKIVWSVGIVEKVILRWRRRGAGLRGFRSAEGVAEGSSGGTSSSLILDEPARDDYDFLQEGRKQTEERLQKALARVKSMAQYPEARDQYQRILTVVSKMQESQAQQDKMLESTEMDETDFMSEFKELWDDDTPLPGYY